jgi:hypothetical protein
MSDRMILGMFLGAGAMFTGMTMNKVWDHHVKRQEYYKNLLIKHNSLEEEYKNFLEKHKTEHGIQDTE